MQKTLPDMNNLITDSKNNLNSFVKIKLQPKDQFRKGKTLALVVFISITSYN